MSFRLFVYYCAVCGGWAAFIGWLLGALIVPHNPNNLIGEAGLKGMFLGLLVAVGLGLVDALWLLSLRQIGQILLRLAIAVVIGGVGGLAGGITGQFLFELSNGVGPVLIVGWTLLGILCGVSVGSYEFLASVVGKKDMRGSRSKLLKCLLGGMIGGMVGGGLALFFRTSLPAMFNHLPTAIGFVALGACIGLLVGLAQVILKEAWVRVEEGFRAGRDMILAKEKTSLGRAEGSDIALFGDAGVEKLHAHIVLQDGRYLLEDNATPGGTIVNDQKVNGRTELFSGDQIRIGKSVLRFYERQKRK